MKPRENDTMRLSIITASIDRAIVISGVSNTRTQCVIVVTGNSFKGSCVFRTVLFESYIACLIYIKVNVCHFRLAIKGICTLSKNSSCIGVHNQKE